METPLHASQNHQSSPERLCLHGQKFTVAIVALGQGNSIVQGTVLSKNVNSNAQYRLSPAIQSTSSLTCIDFDYRLYVTDSEMNDNFVFFKLFLDGPCQSLADGVEIYLNILPCPVGFTLKSEEGECICEEMLQPLTQDCYIDSQSILWSSNNFWMALQVPRTSSHCLMYLRHLYSSLSLPSLLLPSSLWPLATG